MFFPPQWKQSGFKPSFAFWGIPLVALVLLGLLISGVRFVDQYHEAGEYLTPARPVAKEPARFQYVMRTPSGNPVQDADLKLTVSKVKRANPLFFVGYLPEGPILKSQFHSTDGRVDLDAIFWDEGSYLLSIEAASLQGRQNLTEAIPFQVRPPLSIVIRDVLLILGLLGAGFFSGVVGAKLKRARASLSAISTSMILILMAGLILLPSALRADRGHDERTSLAVQGSLGSDQGQPIAVRWEVNPARPKPGEDVTLVGSVIDPESGMPITEVDSDLLVTHGEDHLDLLRLRSHLKEGRLVLNYTFPEGAEYLFTLHAAPTPRSSKLFFPITVRETISVEPKQPDGWTQGRSFLLLTGLGWMGMALGFVYTRHRAKRGGSRFAALPREARGVGASEDLPFV
jgi:hypothetical protein